MDTLADGDILAGDGYSCFWWILLLVVDTLPDGGYSFWWCILLLVMDTLAKKKYISKI